MFLVCNNKDGEYMLVFPRVRCRITLDPTGDLYKVDAFAAGEPAVDVEYWRDRLGWPIVMEFHRDV